MLWASKRRGGKGHRMKHLKSYFLFGPFEKYKEQRGQIIILLSSYSILTNQIDLQVH